MDCSHVVFSVNKFTVNMHSGEQELFVRIRTAHASRPDSLIYVTIRVCTHDGTAII